MSVQVVDSSKQFVSTYLQLINLSENSKASEFYSTSDYKKLQNLGPTLPKIDLRLPTIDSGLDNENSTVTVAVKSIKPPYKFSANLTNLSSSTTVFKLKATLLEAVSELQGSGLVPSSLKLLVKGKVIQDSAVLSSVGDSANISLMCMITPPTPTPTKKMDSDPEISSAVTGEDDAFTGNLSQDAWLKIKKVVEEDGKDSNTTQRIINQFKKVFN